MTKIEELQQILQMQADLTEVLCSILTTKRQAIVGFHGDALADAIAREETLLEPLQKLEEERLACSASIFDSLSPGGAGGKTPPKMHELLTLLGGEDASRLQPLADRLRRSVELILSLNSQNKTLLHHSLRFVKETLRIVTEDHKRQLVDQRI